MTPSLYLIMKDHLSPMTSPQPTRMGMHVIGSINSGLSSGETMKKAFLVLAHHVAFQNGPKMGVCLQAWGSQMMELIEIEN